MRLFSRDTKVEALARVPLFEGLSKKELGQLAMTTEDLEFGPGKVLCKEGQLGREFFVIVEGEVEVERGGKSLGSRGAPDFFGEIALVEHRPRTATVRSKTPLRFFVLTSRGFDRLLEESPAVQGKVMRALAKRVATLSDDPTMAG